MNKESIGRREKQKQKIEPTRKNKMVTPKEEYLNRAQRRTLIKDKNLLKEVLKIITKYFPELMHLFSSLTDKRHKSYITYNIRTIILTRLMALLCGITTMSEISTKFNTEEAIKNLSTICKQELVELPNWQTIQDVLEEISIEEIEAIRKYMAVALIRSKMFDKYRHNGMIQLIVDATGLTSLDYDLNGNCLTKTKDGKTKYYKYVLEAKMVFGNIVISLDSEWIENKKLNNENDKQDCETKAFKRMAKRIKENFPKLKFIVTGDALYATAPMIKICEDYNWKYIFNLKKDRLKNVYESFEDNINYENKTNKHNYYLSNDIEYNDYKLNAFRYVEITKKKTTVFNYISNLNVTNNNIEKVVTMGRRRWKIENEGFNIQKNGTFNISHLCSHNENALKVHYYFIQIAHTIRQLLEYGSILLREMKLKTKKEISSLITELLISKTSDLNNIETNFQLRFDD